MRAVDTNVVVCFLTADDPVQFGRARDALEAGSIFLATGVCLETEWVLRSVYGYKPREIAAALTRIAGMAEVSVESPSVLQQAIEWFTQGMDFADALHLASAEGCETMLSFDAKLAKIASRIGTIPVVAP